MNVAILGCGMIASKMAETLRGIKAQGNKDIVAYAAASRDYDRANTFAKKEGFQKAYGSYEEMLSDPQVDLVYIATPHSEHYKQMKMCIAYGKNVLCEKAFTANAAQACEVLALAKKKGVLVTEAMWVRYMPSVRVIQDVIASGIIGDLTTVTANLYYDIDFKERLLKPELCGGALLDVGIYSLTFASICFGDDYQSMTAACTKFDTGVDLQHSITLIYPDGKMAICSAGATSVSDRKGMIYGKKGFMIIENINNPESITIYDAAYQPIKTITIPEQITGYEYQLYACKEALDQGKLEIEACSHAQTIRMMEIMDEARALMGVKYPYDEI